MESSTLPQPQHLNALELANRIRLARSKLKRRIHAGELSIGEVLTDIPEAMRSMQVLDLLMSQRRWGRARSRRVLTATGIPEQKHLETLTDRQRGALLAVLSSPRRAERNSS